MARLSSKYPGVWISKKANKGRNDSPASLIQKRGVFWGMLQNTGEYDELVQLVGHDA